jgi:hypothetical protein
VLFRKLLEALGLGQRSLEPLDTAQSMILRLVEYFFGLQKS